MEDSTSFFETAVDAAAKHLGVVIVTACIAVGALLYPKFRHALFAPSAPTIDDFTGTWWTNIDGVPGRLVLRQNDDRGIVGTYQLDNGVHGEVRGLYDGQAFYNLVLSDGTRKIFVESAPVSSVGDCLVANAVETEITELQQRRAGKFSARGCE